MAKKLTYYTDGKQYLAGIEYSNAVDVRAHFAKCPEYGFKKYLKFDKLMSIGEYWIYKDELRSKGFVETSFDTITEDIFPNGYTWPIFTKFLIVAFGYEYFLNAVLSAARVNEEPNRMEADREAQRLYKALYSRTKKVS